MVRRGGGLGDTNWLRVFLRTTRQKSDFSKPINSLNKSATLKSVANFQRFFFRRAFDALIPEKNPWKFTHKWNFFPIKDIKFFLRFSWSGSFSLSVRTLIFSECRGKNPGVWTLKNKKNGGFAASNFQNFYLWVSKMFNARSTRRPPPARRASKKKRWFSMLMKSWRKNIDDLTKNTHWRKTIAQKWQYPILISLKKHKGER